MKRGKTIMRNVYVLSVTRYDIDALIDERPCEVQTYVHSAHETASSAHLERERQLRVDRDTYTRRGFNVRIADSTTHLLLKGNDDLVLIRYTFQRTEFFARERDMRRGRKLTSGKFDTRAQLEEFALMKYFTTTCGLAEISRQCKVSTTTIDRIIDMQGAKFRMEHDV
jgi:hypothetical protein